MANNYWIGGNELIIVFRNGTHMVLEGYEDYEPVFVGSFEKCVKYCDDRWTEYQESIIG